jgi:DNA-binding protein HU-beta
MITKTSIAKQVSEETQLLSQAVARVVVNAVFAALANHATRGENVTIQGFGSFRVRNTAPKSGRNPFTGEAMQIPAGRTVTLRVAPALRDLLNPKRKVGGERNSPAAERKRA